MLGLQNQYITGNGRINAERRLKEVAAAQRAAPEGEAPKRTEVVFSL